MTNDIDVDRIEVVVKPKEITRQEIPEAVTSSPTPTISGKLCSIFQSTWTTIQNVSEWVTDFIGITSPRYEMYIDDSLEFLNNPEAQNLDYEEDREYVGISMDQ